ncbi:winged helix DNA-binding protein [Novosphingobium sp.]|uniref:winged helix DNA-binding protein n=1 Tax=Novosphingobium sp. TaxID=1874826 RepID=UPI0035AD83C4
MAQSDFSYASRDNAAGMKMSVSVYADRLHVRAMLTDDAVAIGLPVLHSGGLDGLFCADSPPLPQIVVVDCPDASADRLAQLAELDVRVAQAGTNLIVSTSVASLDGVFGCLDQSGAQILVDPSRAERTLAIGRIMARDPHLRVAELSEEDRLTLLRLTEQVSEMAARLDRIVPPAALDEEGGSAFRLESPRPAFAPASDADGSERLIRSARPPLPDPRLIRRIIRQRQLRKRFFEGDLFADPAWDMLLDLTAARAEHVRVSVTSLCIASAVPPTTALRWIGQLTDAGLFQRVEDEADRRRVFIALTDQAADAMARYFAELGSNAVRLV